MGLDTDALERTLDAATDWLLARRTDRGHWEGELSSSALATATAVFALARTDLSADAPLVRGGIEWLVRSANDDGGWGDTVRSESNFATTMLVWSALTIAQDQEQPAPTISRAEGWLRDRAGGLDPEALANAVLRRYGKDRTFSIPILTMCAIAGRLGGDDEAWGHVAQLPFELAALPHGLWKHLRLQVVSYALPALIAIGLVRHRRLPTRNPLTRLLRRLAARRTLRLLERIQPASGGFLEAAPLTSFVVMSLVAAGCGDHPAAARGAAFLRATVRDDGSWPIDTNLATWVTTQSVNALSPAGLREHLAPPERERIRGWLVEQQYRGVHTYTHSAPGGWSWTDLSGGVPDADDTAGALLAIRHLGPPDAKATEAATAGALWLMGLQNRDGGVGTFCRGWSALPFDRSAPDLTAHMIRALDAWKDQVDASARSRIDSAIGRAVSYLAAAQRADGAWVPLWFGNELAPDRENPTYGTARVVSGLANLRGVRAGVARMLARGAAWLLGARNGDGGWGGAPGVSGSIEETALATEALAEFARAGPLAGGDTDIGAVRDAAVGGAGWLIERTEEGRSFPPAPIGLYFARLWYFERLYPAIFTVAALRRIRDL